jgi:hypothetical protein
MEDGGLAGQIAILLLFHAQARDDALHGVIRRDDVPGTADVSLRTTDAFQMLPEVFGAGLAGSHAPSLRVFAANADRPTLVPYRASGPGQNGIVSGKIQPGAGVAANRQRVAGGSGMVMVSIREALHGIVRKLPNRGGTRRRHRR